MSYDFSRFSTQSFEQFVQALSIAKFGPMTQIFGAGRDGAREATFDGRCVINGEQVWDGYTVIQAKYQQFPGTPSENAAWLIKQIDVELNKFLDEDRSLRRPDYYLIASNGRLSASAGNSLGKGKGGIDSATDHLRDWAIKLGLKGFAIWHEDVLSSILDTEVDVRTSYSFWITPGDVLTAAFSHFQDFEVKTYLPNFLRSQLRKGLDIKTKDAGQTTGKRIFLNDIFVDLPLESAAFTFDVSNYFVEMDAERIHDAPFDSTEIIDTSAIEYNGDDDIDLSSFEEIRPLVVRTIVELSFDRFKSLPRSEEIAKRRQNCIVLMGGPGQGKSTVSQFLGQVFRARLLKDLGGNTSDINQTVSQILQRAELENIPLNGPLRIPIVVDLPVYADVLSNREKEGKHLSLVGYMSEVMSNGEGTLTGIALRRWLSQVPAIFILDGLDEVPHSGNRSDVILAISGLVDTIAEDDIDHVTIVTSRPQGYQKELASEVWRHWEMADLSGPEAIRYGQQLSAVLVSDEARRQEIDAGLLAASREEATAPLMTSPLQVSLLFALVETRNNIPKDRWTLFYRYYEILRDREISKGGESGRLIGDYRNEIDRIHYEAGYLLHLRGEETGGSSPNFSPAEFAEIVNRQMAKSGYDLAGLAEKIVSLATTRLVFLRARTDGEIAFEVRSLQEFMAAARIMASPESKIKDRLKEIAGMSHWLHVFKIACSKAYSSADLEYLRDEILSILDSLDRGDRASEDRVALSGGLLAAEMLTDGVPGKAPSAKRQLMVRAMGLLTTPYSAVPRILAKAVDGATLPIVEESLVASLRDEASVRKLNALRLLLELNQSEDHAIRSWALELFQTFNSVSPDTVLALTATRNIFKHSRAVREWVRTALWMSDIAAAISWSDEIDTNEQVETSEWTSLLGVEVSTRSFARIKAFDSDMLQTLLAFRRHDQLTRIAKPPEFAHRQWHVLSWLSDFHDNPSAKTLAAFLRKASAEPAGVFSMTDVPWIILAAFRLRLSGQSMTSIADDVASGLWGDIDEWKAKEQSWLDGELTPSDFSQTKKLPFFPPIGFRQEPHRTSPGIHIAGPNSALSNISSLARAHPISRGFFIRYLIAFLRRNRVTEIPEDALELLETYSRSIESKFEVERVLGAISWLWSETPIMDRLSELAETLVAKLVAIPASSLIPNRQINDLLDLAVKRRKLLPLVSSAILASRYVKFPHPLSDELLTQHKEDTPLVGEAVALMKFYSGDYSGLGELVTASPVNLRRYLLASRVPTPQANEVLRSLTLTRLTSVNTSIRYEKSLQNLLVSVLQQATSHLHGMRRFCPITFPVATVVRSRLVEVSLAHQGIPDELIARL